MRSVWHAFFVIPVWLIKLKVYVNTLSRSCLNFVLHSQSVRTLHIAESVTASSMSSLSVGIQEKYLRGSEKLSHTLLFKYVRSRRGLFLERVVDQRNHLFKGNVVAMKVEINLPVVGQ